MTGVRTPIWTLACALVLLAGGTVQSHQGHGQAHHDPVMPHAQHKDAARIPMAKADAHQASDVGREAALGTLSLEQVQEILLSLHALKGEQQKAKEVEVRSTVLCFCLQKGKDTIRELRGIEADWFQKGLAYFDANNYAEAIAAFTRVIQLQPKHAWAYSNRGVSYAKMGEYRLAIADLTKAIALEPQLAKTYYARSLVYLLLGNQQQATKDLHRAARFGQ
jgi:tetratricopeptide (TPR) repeat protein